ncbi:unnamed protein product, partial [Ectocarpus sp. 12 AP-2014]
GEGGAGGGPPSSTFYSAFLHPLYVWAQCLDRQFYAQAHRPRVSPAHHLLPRRRGRVGSSNTRQVGSAAPPPALVSSQREGAAAKEAGGYESAAAV